MTPVEALQNMTVAQLRAQAKICHIPLPAGIRKDGIIELLQKSADTSVTEMAANVVSIEPVPPREADEVSPSNAEAEPPARKEQPPMAETEEAPKTGMPRTRRAYHRRAVPVQPSQEKEAAEAAAAAVSPAEPAVQQETAAENTVPGNMDNKPAEAAEAEPARPVQTSTVGGAFNRRPMTDRRTGRFNQNLPQMLDSNECGEARGVLDIQPDGYGFLRAIDPNQKDVYVSVAQIRRFALRNGDLVCGRTRPERENERYLAMLFISTINGLSPEESAKRPQFENLTPIYPNRRLRLESKNGHTELAIRLLDLVAPIGYGQRGLIVSPPKAGKTTLLKDIASAISANAPDAELIVLLIDERPEEVTDMMRSVKGQVYYSTFDQDSAHHITVAEQTLEKARRSVENGKDVVVLLDSITRLARAANLTCTPSGRLLSGGLDPAALAMPKRFFGSARCLEEGGSLTILATALVDTGSRLDDIIYEEFKGTGNMELHLDRKLQERRVFPAMDLYKSGTRHEENLLTQDETRVIWKVRKLLSGNPDDATESLIDMMAKTSDNTAFITRFESWINMMENSCTRK